MSKPIRVAIITNMITTYRRNYVRRILDNSDLNVTIFCQTSIPGMNLPSIHDEFTDSVVEVSFYGAKRELIGWQRLPYKKLILDYDIYFVLGNPRVLSNVVISLLLRLLGKRVVITGQLHTGGSREFFEKIRLAWWRLFRYIYLYNENEEYLLKQKTGFENKILIGMNNGLDQELINIVQAEWTINKLEEWQRQQGIYDRIVILSCARLEPKNHFDKMIDCLPFLISKYPNLLWCVIGGGQLQSELHAKAKGLNVTGAICWLGPIYEEAQLAPWFLSAKVMVHPGSIGLSLLHAFGYSLPVVTHNKELEHMPEYSVLQHGVNGYVYKYGDTDEMAVAISSAINNKYELGKQAKAVVEENFNTRIMAERFYKMCKLAFNN